MTEKETVSRVEAAKMLGIAERTLIRYTEKGKIPALQVKGKTNKAVVYYQEDVEKLKAELEKPIAYKPTIIENPKDDKEQVLDEELPEEKAKSLAIKSNTKLAKDSNDEPSQSTNLILQSITTLLPENIEKLVSAVTTIQSSYKLTLTLAEAATLAGLSKNWLTKAIQEKKLVANKRGKGWNIKRSDLDSYISNL